MTQETQERNKEIALMLGWEYVEERDVWNPNMLHDYSFVKSEDLKFHSDWNWLMDGVNFIKQNIKLSDDEYTKEAKIGEFFIDEWEFRVKKYYLRIIQWTENGWRMFFSANENPELSMYYIIGENCTSEKEAVFLIVSDFAKLYNEGKL